MQFSHKAISFMLFAAVTGGVEHNTIMGTDHISHDSDDATMVGSTGRVLSSDEATELGTELTATESPETVLIGTRLNATNAPGAILIGNDLTTSTPRQILVGSHASPTDAVFAIGAGTEAMGENAFEVLADGTILNAHVAALEARITALTQQMAEFASTHQLQCTPLLCSQVRAAYTAQCCQKEEGALLYLS